MLLDVGGYLEDWLESFDRSVGPWCAQYADVKRIAAACNILPWSVIRSCRRNSVGWHRRS